MNPLLKWEKQRKEDVLMQLTKWDYLAIFINGIYVPYTEQKMQFAAGLEVQVMKKG